MQPNEYALLVKDNERRCANLALADNNTIDVAMETIRKASWNLYEVERVRQDLITMAERAEAGEKRWPKPSAPTAQSSLTQWPERWSPAIFWTGFVHSAPIGISRFILVRIFCRPFSEIHFLF